MLNKIWFWLLLVGILYGFGKSAVLSLLGEPEPTPVVRLESGQPVAESSPSYPAADSGPGPLPSTSPFRATGKAITGAALDAATLSVEICIGLIGVMALWLGMLNIAREAGLVDALARLLQPLMRWLFPEVPDGHPAQGAMLMNIAANMLGLDNAATPFGLKAMRELQTLNPTRDTATNAMATFLAINTSNVTLVPISIIGLRMAAGSTDPAQPLAGMLITTSITTVVAIVAVRALSRRPRYALPSAVEDLNAEPLPDQEIGQEIGPSSSHSSRVQNPPTDQ